MSKKTHKQKIVLSFPVKLIISILVSSIVGTICSLLVSLIFSYFLSNSENITDYTILYLIFSVIIGGFMCGFIGSTLLDFKGLISGLICSVLYIITTFAILFISSDGKLNAYVFIMIFIIIISSCIGGITKVNIRRRK